MAFNQSEYANNFAKEKYDRLNIQVPKGRKAEIEEHWKRKGFKSLNSYVNHLIDADMAGGGTRRAARRIIKLTAGYLYDIIRDKIVEEGYT